MDSLESVLISLEPDFVAVTETRLTKDVRDVELAPPDYSVVLKDRHTNGRGVAIFI